MVNAIPSTLTTTTELIVPVVARQYLEMSQVNRDYILPWIETLARDIQAGKWNHNGESIKFDWNGVLRDGHHRLAACIRADQGFITEVVRGVDPEAVLDVGKPRSFAQNLAMRNRIPAGSHPTTVAAITRLVYQYSHSKRGSGDEEVKSPYSQFLLIPTHEQPSHRELEAMVPGDAPTTELILAGSKLGNSIKKLAPAAHLGAAYTILTPIDPEQAGIFFEALHTGSDLHVGNPILALRDRLLSVRQPRPGFGRPDAWDTLSMVIRAWNYWIRNKQLVTLPSVGRHHQLRGAYVPIPRGRVGLYPPSGPVFARNLSGVLGILDMQLPLTMTDEMSPAEVSL